MAEETAISWCDHTHNAWWGCYKISPGCKHCYAATFDKRVGGDNWQHAGPRRFFGEKHWRKPLAWAERARRDGVRRKVFCSSMADVFERHPHQAIAHSQEAARQRLWALIRETAHSLDWLLLTKRIEEAASMLPWCTDGTHDPYPNVWLGTTAEDDEYARRRLPVLRETPAAKRFVSYEPALGRIDWTPHLTGEGRPDWVIFGDESGHHRRPAELEWARETRDACAAAGVAFHFKQSHSLDVEGARDRAGKIHLPVLDGRQHAEFPS